MASAGESRTLKVTAFSFSQRAQFLAEDTKAGSDVECSFEWDAEKFALLTGSKSCTVQWQHVTGIWTSLCRHPSQGFLLDVTLETSHAACEFDFVQCKAIMDGTGGEFLTFLQSSHLGRLKEGRVPGFATSRWASCLLSSGFSVRTLRLWLGRASIVFEVLYSLCFFAQLQTILVTKEAKLFAAFAELGSDFYVFTAELFASLQVLVMEFQIWDLCWLGLFGLPQGIVSVCWKAAFHASDWLVLLLLLQHVFVVIFAVDGLWRVLCGAFKSAMTFHKAATKVNKAVKKSITKDKVAKEGDDKPEDRASAQNTG